MKKHLLTLLFTLCCLLCVEARGLARFQHLSIKDGLSSLCAGPTYQDEFGMVWICTNNGLNRFDGRSVEVFKPILGDSTSLYNNNVRTVCGNRNGKIWVVSKYALSEFDMATEKFRTIRTKGVRTICYNNATLWVAGYSQIWTLNPQGELQHSLPGPQTEQGLLALLE